MKCTLMLQAVISGYNNMIDAILQEYGVVYDDNLSVVSPLNIGQLIANSNFTKKEIIVDITRSAAKKFRDTYICRNHLLGEHGEIHKHRHNFVKGHSVADRLGQIEPASMQSRHDELAEEMLRRGFNHNSPYEQPDLSGYDLSEFTVDRSAAKVDLFERCEECKSRG